MDVPHRFGSFMALNSDVGKFKKNESLVKVVLAKYKNFHAETTSIMCVFQI